MTRRLPVLAATLMLAAAAAQALPYKATLLVRDDDPRLARNRVERAYFGHPTGAPADGLAVALKEAELEMESAGTSVKLDVVPVGSAAAAKDAAAKAEKAGAAALVAELPTDWLLAATDAVKLPVLNIGEAADRLRGPDCRPRLLHLLPSERMRADAIGQWLVARKWA
jgi:ABC transporter substrate binding protein (PQQ-dependent alcohol dehydrogenase system)